MDKRTRIYRISNPGRDGSLDGDVLVLGPQGKVRAIYGGRIREGSVQSRLIEWLGADCSAFRELDERSEILLAEQTAKELWTPIYDSSIEHGPKTRGVVVIERRLDTMVDQLRERNIRVLVASDDFVVETLRLPLLANRVFITLDGELYVYDAPCYDIGIVSLRLLSSLEPASTVKIIATVLTQFAAWHKRHGWCLVLRDDGVHEYRPLAD